MAQFIMQNLKINFIPTEDNEDLKTLLIDCIGNDNLDAEAFISGYREFLIGNTNTSVMTGAVFDVRAIVKRNMKGKWRLSACQVSLNAPLCLVGNDLLLFNDVELACEVAFLMLQDALRMASLWEICDGLFDVKRAQIVSCTAAFFVMTESNASANNLLKNLAQHVDAIHNIPNPRDPWAPEPLTHHGSVVNGKWHLQLKAGDIRFYALNDPVYRTMQENFEERHYEPLDPYFDFIRKFLKFEVDLSKQFLRKHVLREPGAWCSNNGDVYAKILSRLNTALFGSSRLSFLLVEDDEFCRLRVTNQYKDVAVFEEATSRLEAAIEFTSDFALPSEYERFVFDPKTAAPLLNTLKEKVNS